MLYDLHIAHLVFQGRGQSQCVDRWMQLQFALEALDISSEEARGLWAPVAAIYHLGAAGVSTGNLSVK